MELGGVEAVINKGDKVLVKPNFNTVDPAPASTAFDFLKAVIDLVDQAGASAIIVGESSTIFKNTEGEFKKLDAYSLSEYNHRVQVMNFEKHSWIKKEINGEYLKSVSVPDILDKVDKIIYLPCLKTHTIAQFTGSLKLSVGIMRPKERAMLHLGKVQEKIVDLNRIIKPDLIIMDARSCFINKGPMLGETKEPNFILASRSRVNIDIEGVRIIKSFPNNSLADVDPEKLIQIKLAKEGGIE